jgi:rhodanese-related sulfurtransferase
MSEGEYAGDLSPKESWELLAQNSNAILVDVRTPAEWAFVGRPDLSDLAKQPVLLSWQLFPSMQVNPDFVDELKSENIEPDAPILFLCRSGTRSRFAAIALTAQGFSRCYNIASGFEGDPDPQKHRGTVNGWKVDGLPWIQE